MKLPITKGTAFALAPDRFLTCNHVIEGKDPRTIKLTGSADPTAGQSTLIIHNVTETKCDSQLDIALMKTERVQGDIVQIALESGPPLVGLDILAVGYPLTEQQLPEVRESEKHVHVQCRGYP
jgi:S1-C subfamily serine protease